jgi:hypothetical protein
MGETMHRGRVLAQLLMLGIIGEYVGRAFLTVAGRPQSLVREVFTRQEVLA